MIVIVFSKSSVLKILSLHTISLTRKAELFKFLRLEECFRFRGRSVWTVGLTEGVKSCVFRVLQGSDNEP